MLTGYVLQVKYPSPVSTAVFYIHIEDVDRPLEVTVAEKMNRDSEILVSYPTLRKMGVIPKAWPQISKEAFRAWDHRIK